MNVCCMTICRKGAQQTLLGRLKGGLYITSEVHLEMDYKKGFLSIKEDLSIWHPRPGHMPFSKMKLFQDLSGLKNPSQ